MAYNVWIGNAQGVADVWHLTPANVEIGDTFTVEINNKQVSYTLPAGVTYNATTGYVSALVDALVARLSASTIPEFTEVTWEAAYDDDDNSTHIVASGPSDGTPIAISASAANGGTFAVSVQTLQSGEPVANEVQQVSLPGPPTGGTFKLTFAGEVTGNIAYNASAATVQAALEGLSNIAPGDVVVTGSDGGPWVIEFDATYAQQNVPLIIGNGSSLTGAAYIEVTTETQGGTTDEIQTVVLTYDGLGDGYYSLTALDLLAGSKVWIYWLDLQQAASPRGYLQQQFDATYGAGNTSIALTELGSESCTFAVTFTGVHAGLDVQGLEGDTSERSGIAAGITVDREGSVTPIAEVQKLVFRNNPTGGTFTLIFQGATTGALSLSASAGDIEAALDALVVGVDFTVVYTSSNPLTYEVQITPHADVMQLQADSSNLTGSRVAVVTTQSASAGSNEVQHVSLTNNPRGGTFTLTFNAETTGNIAWNASAATVQAAIEALATPVPGDVAVSGPAGGPWVVEFTGNYAATNVASITGSAANLTAGGAQTFTASHPTTGTGPHHFDNADNWSAGTSPADDEILVFQNSAVSCLYGLSSAAVTPEKVIIYSDYTGQIGLPRHTGEYLEYRDTALRIGAHGDGSSPLLTIEIGEGDGTGSPLIRLNTGDKQTKLVVTNTGSSAENSSPAVNWVGTHASNEAHCYQGSLGIAHFAGQVASVAALHQGFVDSIEGDSQVSVGEGVTLGQVVKNGGVLRLAAGCDWLLNEAGVTEVTGSGDVGALDCSGGTCYLSTSGIVGKYGAITGITQANPAVVTSNGHGLATGDVVRIGGVVGMTEVNQREFTVTVLTADTFALAGVNSSGYAAYSAGGYWGKLGSVKVQRTGTLDFARTLAARQAAVAIDVQGDSARVIDFSKRISTLTYLSGEFAVHWRGTTRNPDLGYDFVEVRR